MTILQSTRRHSSTVEQRLADYESLLEIGVELASSLDPSEVLELALEKVEAVCDAESSSIWEVDEERGELFFRTVRGLGAGKIRSRRLALGEGIAGNVALTGKAEIANDVQADPRFHTYGDTNFLPQAMLTVPLISRARVIGVLQLLNSSGRPGFTSDDQRRMELFAGLLAPAIENARLYARQKCQFFGIVTALAEAIDKRDPYTGNHVRRVVAYSLLLGRELGLNDTQLEELRLAATLHDVGKISVPDIILQKPSALDTAEFEVMKRHTIDGATIVSQLHELRHLAEVVRSHHEHFDGSGYPDGLAGDDIPMGVRIVAIADAFDAMTTSRPYREAQSHERAAKEICRTSGSQFCPQVSEVFQQLFQAGQFTVEAGQEVLQQLAEALGVRPEDACT